MKKRTVIVALMISTVVLGGCGDKKDKNQYISKGMEAIEQKDYESAIEQFDQATAGEISLLQAYRGLGIAYLEKGDYPNAIVNFSKALNEKQAKNKEIKSDLLSYKGMAHFKNKDFQDAVEVYTQVIEEGKDEQAYYLRGVSYLSLDQIEKADEDFHKALENKGNSYELYFDIYEAFLQKDRKDKGDLYLYEALEKNKESASTAYERGQVYFYLEEYEKAKELLSKVEDKEHKEASMLLGKVYYKLEEVDHGIEVFQEYIAKYGEDASAYNGLAMGQIQQENYDEALKSIEQGLALSDESEEQNLRFNEIVVYEGKVDFETAKEKAADYVQKYPGDRNGKREYDFLQTR